jgi:predicted Zn finger-like uncharacterized protein
MIVRCASCKTEFALDDRQVGPDGASVRCSVCGTVFRVEPESEQTEPPWQVRTLEDLLFTAPDLATLRSWILEGRLHPDDKVSRTGRHFVRLGDMPEFSAAFEGFSGLPQLVVADGRGPSEHSALQVLGPPPAFGTEGPSSGDSAALSGVPESTGADPSAALSTVMGAGISSSALDFGGRPSVLDDPGSMEAATVADDQRTVARAPAVPDRVATGTTPPHGFRPIVAGPPMRPPPLPAGTPRAGIPTAVADDRSSRPASMLDAVTQHVRPIRAPIVETARSAVPPPPPPAIEPPPPRTVETTPSFDFDDDDDRPRKRGRRSWPVWAALGVLAGSAVVFGIPSVRAKLFGEQPPMPVASTAPDDGAVLQEAERALQSADPAALARAESALQVTIDGRPAGESKGLEVIRGELLATRALTHELWGAIDPAMRNDARFWAQEDASRAAGALAELDAASVPDPDRLARAHAILHVAQGRTEPTALPEDPELPLLVTATPLLRDDHAKLPAATRDALANLAKPSVLARLTLGLAQLHDADTKGARATAEALLADVPEQPAARALARRASATAGPTPDAKQDEPVASEGGTTPTPTGDDDPVMIATPTGESPERLIDKGCRKVEGGDASGAVPLLRKALEKKPNDLDALLCLGDANVKLGSYDAALRSYEKALGRSPDMMTALQGAARASARLGRTQKAVQYYRRLLEHDPGHSQARAYVDAHESGGTPEPSASDGDSMG